MAGSTTPTSTRATRRGEEAQASSAGLRYPSGPEKRLLYDRYGDAAFEGMAAAGARTSASKWTARLGEPGHETIDISESLAARPGRRSPGGRGRCGNIFEHLLGRCGPPAGQIARRRSVEARLTIPFLTAVRGARS